MRVSRRRPDGWLTFPALLPHAARKAGKQRQCNIGRGGHDKPHDQEGAQQNGKMGNGVAQENVDERSEEHTSELQSLMRISYAVFCLKKKKTQKQKTTSNNKNNKTKTKNKKKEPT